MLCALMTGIAVAAWSQSYLGEEPQAGKSYYLWNIGQKLFLSSDNGLLGLSASGTGITVITADDGTALHLTTTGGRLGSSLYEAPRADGQAANDRWTVCLTDDSTRTYTLANCYTEGSDLHLLYSAALRHLVMRPEQPGVDDGLWRFVDPGVVTGIEEVATPKASRRQQADETIYNLQGQTVGHHSTDGLSGGIYIRNGKKIVKK